MAQFWNCIMDGFANGHSGAHSGLWGNRKYLQMKTWEKLSEKLLCDVSIPLKGLYLFSHKSLFEHSSCNTEKVIFCSTLKTMSKSEISWNKTQKEVFQGTILCHVHSFQRVEAYTAMPNLETLSLRNLWWDIKWRLEVCDEKGNVFRWKLERSFLRNCFVFR